MTGAQTEVFNFEVENLPMRTLVGWLFGYLDIWIFIYLQVKGDNIKYDILIAV